PKIRSGGQSTPHFFCCYVSERAELGFLQLADFCCLGWGDKIAAAAGNQSKIFDSCKIPSGQNFSHHAHFLLQIWLNFNPPPQPDTVEGDGFIARLGGAKALPKFRARATSM
uniref:EH domain-containing protein n=1 Tax=Macrostomum lignano TaxID=282301 RepID=A0A1I8FZW3_9PLAT